LERKNALGSWFISHDFGVDDAGIDILGHMHFEHFQNIRVRLGHILKVSAENLEIRGRIRLPGSYLFGNEFILANRRIYIHR